MRLDKNILSTLFVFGLSAVVFYLYTCLFSIQQGRDFETYISYYVQMYPAKPVDHLLMLFRTPGAPLFFGALHRLGGPPLVSAALCALYALGNTLLFSLLKKHWGLLFAVLWLVAVFSMTAYNWAYHTVASESVYCFAVVLLVWSVLRAFESPSAGRWGGCGLAVFVLTMIRPGSQVFFLLAAAPALLRHTPFRVKVRLCAAFLAPLLILLPAYAAINFQRYGDFVVARGGGALLPGYRVFILDRLMRPENGPDSQKLAQAVENDLLHRELYKKYKITTDILFLSGDSSIYNDMIAMHDSYFGWNTDYKYLRGAAIEAILASPATYVKSVLRSLWIVFSTSEHDIYAKIKESWPGSSVRNEHARALGASGLKVPDYGDLLPSSTFYWITSGSGKLQPSPEEVQRVRRKTRDIVKQYPTPEEATANKPKLVAFWYTLSQLTAKMYVCVLLGLAAFWGRDWRARAIASLYAATAITLAATYSGTDTVFQFRNPFDPFFVLAGLHGLFFLMKKSRETKTALTSG